MLHTAAALRAHGIDIDVLLPRGWRQLSLNRTSLTEVAARHYNIPENRLSLIPLPPVLQLPGNSQNESIDTISTMLADVSAMPWAFFRTRRGGYDLVYTRRWPMAVLATRIGIRTVFETYTARSAGLLRRHCNPDLLTAVVVHSRLAAGWVAEQGLPQDRVSVCYNGYNPEDLFPVLDRQQARSSLGLPLDRPIVCYAGRLKSRKAPDSIVQVARRTPEVLFVLVGATGGEGRGLQNGLVNVLVPKWVDSAELSRYVYAADLLMIPPSSLPLKSGRTVLPLKTFLYMASGRPIIGPDLPDLREILEHGRNAILTAPDRPDEAAKAVLEVLSDRHLAERIGRTAAEDARRFTWHERGRKLAEFLRNRAG